MIFANSETDNLHTASISSCFLKTLHVLPDNKGNKRSICPLKVKQKVGDQFNHLKIRVIFV